MSTSTPVLPDGPPVPPIVDVAWALEHRHSRPDDLVFVDVRWYLDGRSGRDAYLAGHLGGAVFADIDTDLAGPMDDPQGGRHPLPTPECFAAAMSRLGVGSDAVVVAYDDTGGMTAGRLVVMLRGIGRAAGLLDGGIAAWPEPLESGQVTRPAARFDAHAWPDRFIISADALVEAQGSGAVLLDARAGDRYRGEPNPVDKRLGHIPGAVNLPWGELVADGRLRPTDDVRAAARARGITHGTEVIASCGSGISACLDLLALEAAGLGTGRLFVPSWSGWAADPTRAAAMGAEPGGQ